MKVNEDGYYFMDIETVSVNPSEVGEFITQVEDIRLIFDRVLVGIIRIAQTPTRFFVSSIRYQVNPDGITTEGDLDKFTETDDTNTVSKLMIDALVTTFNRTLEGESDYVSIN